MPKTGLRNETKEDPTKVTWTAPASTGVKGEGQGQRQRTASGRPASLYSSMAAQRRKERYRAPGDGRVHLRGGKECGVCLRDLCSWQRSGILLSQCSRCVGIVRVLVSGGNRWTRIVRPARMGLDRSLSTEKELVQYMKNERVITVNADVS